MRGARINEMMPINPTIPIRPERIDHQTISAQFDHLIDELLAGKMNRCKFETWEIDILLDIVGCDLGRFTRPFVLRQYQEAVLRQLAKGGALPMKLSDFLATRSPSRGKQPRAGLGRSWQSNGDERHASICSTES